MSSEEDTYSEEYNSYDDKEDDKEDYDEEDDLDLIDEWLDEVIIDDGKKTSYKDVELDKQLNDKYSQMNQTEGSKEATQRLIADLKALSKSGVEKLGISATPINDNLYMWEVKFFNFEADIPLSRDLKEYQRKTNNQSDESITLMMRFPKDYPYSPPFIYVTKPRFMFHTGHVTVGGSICMELLTASGWRPVNDIESILMQIRSEMIEGGARLDLSNHNMGYTESEAIEAFKRVARFHGWEK